MTAKQCYVTLNITKQCYATDLLLNNFIERGKSLISKKDLLKETGISYGQLYRWKRENLIPEEWFIKQSSFTGQETFFPREKILGRIKAIQELKDEYSLEELAKMLSPEISQRVFTKKDFSVIEEIDMDLVPIFLNDFEESSFTFIEVIIMIAFSKLKKEFYEIKQEHYISMINGIMDYYQKLKNIEYTLMIYYKSKEYYAVLCSNNSMFFIDKSLELINSIKLDEISNIIKIKYKNSLNFKF